MVLVSSIFGKLTLDDTIPLDCAIEAYCGSTTKEKLKNIGKTTKQKKIPKQIFVLQDDTNSIMKYIRTVHEVLDEYVALINKCDNLFKLNVFVICEVIPIL